MVKDEDQMGSHGAAGPNYSRADVPNASRSLLSQARASPSSDDPDLAGLCLEGLDRDACRTFTRHLSAMALS